MNQALTLRLKKELERIREQSFDETKLRQLVKIEATKLIEKWKSEPQTGLSEEKLLTHLETIFGSKNFQKGKYKPKKEVIREIIVETTQELFGGQENFVNGEYTGGWNQTQDLAHLKQSLETGEAKTLTSQIVEQKLGGSAKFPNGIYQPKPEIIQAVIEELEAKGIILKKMRNIFGEEKFFDDEPSDDIPKGKEGYYKDPKAIAILEHDARKEIESLDKWDNFWRTHSIGDSSEKSWWMNNYPANPDGAEEFYKDNILKAAEIVGEDKPLNDLEKNRIMKATTPEKIQEVLTNIPLEREKKEWDKFFRDHDVLGRIKAEWQDTWRNSGLTIEVAKLIYNNGWNNDPNGLIDNNKIIENYTTEILVMGQKYPQTTSGIETLKHVAEEVDKVHEFMVKRIETETNLDKFPTDDEISNAYQEKKVPDTKSWAEVIKIRDNKIKSLFKQYFQGSTPTNLKDDEIELWRTAPTGLANTGTDQRKAFDNGWTNPAEITNSQTTYQNITNIEVLKVNKKDIDQEIIKVNQLVQKIANFKHLRELDAIQKDIDQQFNELKINLLPPNKSQEITDIVTKQRQNLHYSLTDKDDGGLEKSELETILKKMNNRVWDAPNYDQMITKVLNQWLKADQGIQEMNKSLDERIKKAKDPAEKAALEAQKLLQPNRPYENLDEPNPDLYGTDPETGQPHSWLTSQKGYTIPNDIVQAEAKLPLEKRGLRLLRYFYEKAKDGKNRPFNPDKLNEPEAQKYCFCLPGKATITYEKKGWVSNEIVTKEIDIIGGEKATQGHLALAAGAGKTTKTVNCLVNGGRENVILFCPTPTLTESAAKHHSTWLQSDYGCVYHKKSKMVWVLKGTLKPATEEEVKNGQAEEAEIFESHGPYPVAKNDLTYWVDDQGNPGGQKGLSVLYFGYLLGYKAREKMVETEAIDEWQPDNTPEWNDQALEKIKIAIKGKLIPKDSIIVFDEAHYNSGAYQALQLKMVQADYKVIRLSATFPGVPFSTTSTYPKASYYSGELDPNMPAGMMRLTKKQAELLATIRGVEPEAIAWQNDQGQTLPVEVKLEERLRVGKTLIFLKSLQLSEEQLKIFGNQYSCVVFTEEFKEFCETVSFGRQPGAVMGLNFEHEMGLTFEADTVISTGLVEVSNLGKNFTFSEKITQFVPNASLIQQQGRVGRIMEGLWITLTKQTQEIVMEEDVEAAMVKACFDGDITPIKEAEYPFHDIKMLWGGLAHPHRFGKPPSEALIGLKVDESEQKRVKNQEPLTKITWRTPADKKDLEVKGWFSSVLPDQALWERYLGKTQAMAMNEDQAQDLLKELITNFITKDNRFPQGLKLRNQSNLIGAVYQKRLEKGDEEQKKVSEEIRNVLNGVIEKEIKNYVNSGNYDDTNQFSKDPKVIKNIADLYRLNNAEVNFTFEPNEEKKEVWTLNIKHNIIRT